MEIPPTIVLALTGAIVVILGAAGVYIGGRIANKTVTEKADAVLEEKAAALKSEIEAMNVEDRKALRKYFEEQVTDLKRQLRECREANAKLQKRLDDLEGKGAP